MPDHDPRVLERLRADVEFLASDDCGGRAPGTPGGRLARNHIESRLADLDVAPSGREGFRHPIVPIDGTNLVGTIPGQGPMADRHVVVAAHYDHLGVIGGEIYRGADDNGSGVAVLLEVARRLAADRSTLGRSILVCSFDAEEPPNFLTPTMGSVAWVADPTVPLDRIDQMVCLDIAGRRLGGPDTPDPVAESIFVLGGERSSAGPIVDRHREGEKIHLRRADADLVPPLSDHFAFEMSQIPFLFLTCGRSAAYHTPEDTPDRLDYEKMAGLAGVLTDLVVDLSNAGGIGTYRPGARNDRITLDTMTELLQMLAPSDPDVDVALDLVGQAHGLLDGDRLPGWAHDRLGQLLITMEESLANS